MTTVFCSNKLKESGVILNVSTANDNLTGPGWNAHLFGFSKKKHLIFVHNRSYYCVVIDNIKKDNILNIGNLFTYRLVEQWIADKIIDELEGLIHLQKLLPVKLYKTNNDKITIGAINALIDSYTAALNQPYWFGKTTIQINSGLNEIPSGAGMARGKYSNPIENMRRVLGKEG